MLNLLHAHWVYLMILCVSLVGLCLCDWRWRLLVWRGSKAPGWDSPQVKATRATLGVLLGLFLLWDICGIMLGIFRTNPTYTVGLNLFTSNLPIEEVLFLILLIYVTLLTYKASERLAAKRGME